jgi:adhesin transport system outer membrane protein
MIKIAITSASLTIALLASQTVTLKGTVEYMLATNPEVMSLKSNQEVTKKYIDEEESKLYPTIDFEMSADRTRTKKGIVKNRKTNLNAQIDLKHNLYNSGEIEKRIKQASHAQRANLYENLHKTEEIILNATKTYLELAKLRELILVTSHNLKLHERILHTAKENEAVSGESLGRIQTESKLKLTKSKLIEYLNNEQRAKSDYKKLVGFLPSGETCKPALDLSLIKKTASKAMKYTAGNNEKIKSKIELIKEQLSLIDSKKATLYPTLDFEVQGSKFKTLGEDDSKTDEYYGKLVLNYNLFDGGQKRAIIEKERVFLEELKHDLEATTREVLVETDKAYKSYFTTLDKVNYLNDYVSLNLDIVKKYYEQFEGGSRTILDLLTSEDDLFESKIKLIEEEYKASEYYFDMLHYSSDLIDTLLVSREGLCGNRFRDDRLKKFVNFKKHDDTYEINSISDELNLESNNSSQISLPNETQSPTTLADERTKPNKSDIKLQKEFSHEVFTGKLDSKYTINIGTFYSLNQAQKYIKFYELENKSFVYTYGPDNKYVKVLYGNYDNLIDAKKDKKKLHADVLVNKPFIDYAKKYRQMYRKYN